MDEPAFDESQDERTSDALIKLNPRPRRTRTTWIAWIVIILTIAFLVAPRNVVEREEGTDSSLVMQELQAKYLMGARSLGIIPAESLREQAELVFGSGSIRQQLIGPILVGELSGPKAALNSLNQLQDREDKLFEKAPESDRKLFGLLEKVFLARNEQLDLRTAWTEEERQELKTVLPEKLGWAGGLALLPAETSDQAERTRLLGQARNTFVAILCVFGCGATAVAVGIVLQLVWWGLMIAGRLSRGITALRGDQAIYAETFAAWLVLYVGLAFVISLLPLDHFGMTTILIPMIGGLGALAWPVIRGIRWRDVRTDIGLYWDKPVWSPPFVGVGSYVAALPLLGCAMITTLLLMKLSSMLAAGGDSAATPIHPIVEPILHGSWVMRMQLMFVAVFAAIPEEIMFRGVLYRHLREGGARPGSTGRMIFAMLISSFVFAAIHPQGLFGIPILMTIAMVLAVVREWRGSLVPCMIAHGMVNSVTTIILLLMAD